MRVPTCPSLAPCSPPSRPLRAASGGGLRPVLTAAARGATANPGRDEETAPLRSNKETALATTSLAQLRQHNRLIANPVGPAPAGHPATSSRQRRHNGQDLVGTLRHVIAHQQRAAMLGNPIRETHRGQRSADRA